MGFGPLFWMPQREWGDAFVMASLGCQVQLLERSPIVYELFGQAFSKGCLKQSMRRRRPWGECGSVSGDSLEWLKRQEPEFVDVVYLDPMFPSREKSALVKRKCSSSSGGRSG